MLLHRECTALYCIWSTAESINLMWDISRGQIPSPAPGGSGNGILIIHSLVVLILCSNSYSEEASEYTVLDKVSDHDYKPQPVLEVADRINANLQISKVK